MGEMELEEGKSYSYRNHHDVDDDSAIDPDTSLAYIDKKIQDVLGHFQKDFEDGVSYEKLGARFGGYGSFLPTYERYPITQHPQTPQKKVVPVHSDPKTISYKRKELELGLGGGAVMGEAYSYRNHDSAVDPDISLSYIDEKIQDVLGHFQYDFEGGVSYEKLGAKFGGYGSFLSTTEEETSLQDTSMEEETSVFSAPTIQSKCWLTIKVNYGGELFTFRLSSSSEIIELSQQVSLRLNLEDGTYNVKYLDDDNDWILLTCDEDLRLYIECSMKQEKYILMMTIEPK